MISAQKIFLAASSAALLSGCQSKPEAPQPKPNIIWVVMEDICPDLGCYGNDIVKTPNLDRIAAEGIKFTNAYATSPVCSPARSAFFTGMNQTSIGAHHHRSHMDDGYKLPGEVKLLSDYLRDAGYHNLLMGPKQKTDFNFYEPPNVFDGTDRKRSAVMGAYVHCPLDTKILGGPAWKSYKKDKPFFAQINYSEAHRTFIADKENPIDPAKVTIPKCYPDHDITRRDWALYLETVQFLDKKIGNLMKELEEHDALDNTVIFFFGDHGRPMLRGKQWLYDGGIKVPMMVWGKGIKGGQVRDDMVSLIDLMPTTMDMAGVDVPEYIDGKVLIGDKTEKREYIFAQRDRCDETDDRIRAVRNKRFKYIRNYYPERPYTQFNAYKKLQYPVLTLMQVLNDQDKLAPEQAQFMASTRPAEELYDTLADPDEVYNLASTPKYTQQLQTMRTALDQWEIRTGDKGRVHEDPLVKEYWDTFFVEHFEKGMKARGLSTDMPDTEYLKWWNKELRRQGK